MSHIFVSYSTKNRDYAYRLVDALRDAGFNVWIDNDELRAGDEWWESIVRALRAAAAFVVVMSPDSRQSRWVQREILLAEKWDKPSFPLLLEGENFEIYVDTQFYDLRDKSMPAKKFYEHLEQVAERKANQGKIVTEMPSAQAPKDAEVREAMKNPPKGNTRPLNEAKSAFTTAIDWIKIPSGNVRLEAGGYLKEAASFAVRPFSMSKYPITNQQFAEFIAADGYENSACWTSEGWQTRLEGWALVDSEWRATGKAWKEPLYWQNSRFNAPEQPVVGVSWYEAIAYCAWLSQQEKKLISLPTEQEWQRAAQGNDERVYPWGNQWNWRYCNSSVDATGIGKTSFVREYEGQGDSPFAVVDMAGNVSEWCLTAYKTGNNDTSGKVTRLLRGGSRYSTVATQLRCASRDVGEPDTRNNFTGFRVVLKSSGR
jgi:formylglycine-generating enzyme required for sulfatase activity